MAVVVGTNSYGDEAGLLAYATARGTTITGDQTELLIKTMDWLEIQVYNGRKYEEFQALEFPRSPTLYGEVAGVVPDDVVTAQYVGALLIDSGETLNPVIGRETKMEKVDVIEVEYMDGAASKTLYPQLTGLLRPFLGSSGSSFTVKRG